MQQVFFQETEFLNSVIDYNHKIEAENLSWILLMGLTKNFLFDAEYRLLHYCTTVIKGNQLCFHIFTDYFGDDDRKYFDALGQQYKNKN